MVDSTAQVRASLDLDDLTPRQRALVGDVVIAAGEVADLEPDQYGAQDEAVTVLREQWSRLVQSMPGTAR